MAGKFDNAMAGMGQGIVSPFLRFGATANSALRGTVNLTKAALGDRDALGREARAQQAEAQSPQYLRPTLTAREVVGVGGQLATAIGGAGLTKGIVDLTGGLASRAAIGALSGGVLGLTGGAGVGLENAGAQRLGVAGTVDLTARTGIAGAAIGAGVGGAVGAVADKWNAPRKPDELDRLLSEAEDFNRRAKAKVGAMKAENEALRAGGEAIEGVKALPGAGAKPTFTSADDAVSWLKAQTGEHPMRMETRLAMAELQGKPAPYTSEQVDALYAWHDLKNPKSEYLYHTTPFSNLESIGKEGLVTGKTPRFEGVSGEGKLSFSASEEGANYYGGTDDALLRVKKGFKFDDLAADPLAGGEGSYVTGKNVPPEMLEVKQSDGSWKPLVSTKTPLPGQTPFPGPGAQGLKPDPLMAEAQKYGTAEEFVKGQKAIFHGTTKQFDKFDPELSPGGSAWFTDSRKALETGADVGLSRRAGETVKIMDRFVKPGLKLVDRSTAEGAKMADDLMGAQLEGMGYRGIIHEPDGVRGRYVELFYPNEDALTKPQLIDIWNKAHKK